MVPKLWEPLILPHKCFLKRRMSKSGADLLLSLVKLEEMSNWRGAEKV